MSDKKAFRVTVGKRIFMISEPSKEKLALIRELKKKMGAAAKELASETSRVELKSDEKGNLWLTTWKSDKPTYSALSIAASKEYFEPFSDVLRLLFEQTDNIDLNTLTLSRKFFLKGISIALCFSVLEKAEEYWDI